MVRPGHFHRSSVWLCVLLLATGLSACDLSEVVVPVGEPVVVVHGVIRPDLPEEFRNRQYILVERSLTGLLNPEDGTEADSSGCVLHGVGGSEGGM